MRDNGPVTQQEYPIREEDTLLSTTDLKGRIVYANETFIQVSGYERDELYGKAHNMVRHPDMPPEAFADLWQTLAQGQTWTGLVKNRRKNGDHYWVRANVTPVRERGEVVGYLSVRTKPGADEVRAHEEVYRRIRAGDTTWRIRRGAAERVGWRQCGARWRRLSLAARVRLALGSVAACAVAAPWWAAPVTPSAASAAWSVVPVVVMALWMWFWLDRSVVQPLRAISDEARSVASGQRARSLYLNRTDDMGVLMRRIEQAGLNLVALVGDIQRKSTRVSTDAERMKQGNQELSARAEEAARHLQQTASAMEQLATAVQANTATSGQASELAREAAQVTRTGA